MDDDVTTRIVKLQIYPHTGAHNWFYRFRSNLQT